MRDLLVTLSLVLMVSLTDVSRCAAGPSRLSKTVLPEGVLLVQATVTEIKDQEVRSIATVKISHVFRGPRRLIGNTFLVGTADIPPEGYDGTITPRLNARENGLWLLREIGDTIIHWRGSDLPIAWPARKGITPRYEQAHQLAEAIEQVLKEASEEKQLRLLEAYAVDQTPEVSAWAVTVLGDLTIDEQLAGFLKRLLRNEQVTVTGQVALDEALLKIEKRDWQRSPERLRLLKTWVSANLSRYEADRVFRRLDLLAQHPKYEGIEQAELIDLVRTAIANQGLPLESRRHAHIIIGCIPRRYEDDAPAFEFLLDVIQHAREQELRLDAARALRWMSLDCGRRAKVAAVQESLQDEKLANALQKIVERVQK